MIDKLKTSITVTNPTTALTVQANARSAAQAPSRAGWERTGGGRFKGCGVACRPRRAARGSHGARTDPRAALCLLLGVLVAPS